MADFTKLITAVSTPAAEAVGKVVETAGKTSMGVGGVAYVAEKAAVVPFTLTEYAAIVSIAGGLVWIAKMLFDSFIVWLKYRRGD